MIKTMRYKGDEADFVVIAPHEEGIDTLATTMHMIVGAA